MLSRRQLLAALAGAAAIAADPERALWVPGRKLISIPKPRGNVIITGDQFAREALEILKSGLVLADVRLHKPRVGDWILVDWMEPAIMQSPRRAGRLPHGLYEINSAQRLNGDETQSGHQSYRVALRKLERGLG